MLFGMYLCGTELPVVEQRELVEFLRGRYGERARELATVLRCLFHSNIVRRRAGILACLEDDSWAASCPAAHEKTPDERFVERLVPRKSVAVSYGRTGPRFV